MSACRTRCSSRADDLAFDRFSSGALTPRGLRVPVGPAVDPNDGRFVVRSLDGVGELGVDMDDVVDVQELADEVGAEQDLVENLRVALEDVGVPLHRREVLDHEWRAPPASRMSTVCENSKSLMSPRTITLASGSRASTCDEVVDDLCLAVASDLAETGRWLCRAEERLVVGLRAEVVDDDEQLLAASSELADEGLSCVVERR